MAVIRWSGRLDFANVYICYLIVQKNGRVVLNLGDQPIDFAMENDFREICHTVLLSKQPSLDQFNEICGLLQAGQTIFAHFKGKIGDRYANVINDFQHSLIMLASLIVGEDATGNEKNLVEHLTKTLQAFRVNRPVQTVEATENRKAGAEMTLDHLLAQLDGLIGLASVKTEVRSLVNLMRRLIPLSQVPPHLAFKQRRTRGGGGAGILREA
jgi:hypothetical protein